MSKLINRIRDIGMDWVINASVQSLKISRIEQWNMFYFGFTVPALKIFWWSFWADVALFVANCLLFRIYRLFFIKK